MAVARRKWPIGTVVSYKYQGLTTANEVPRFPTFLRVRTDKSWTEVVADEHADRVAARKIAKPKLVRVPSFMVCEGNSESDSAGDAASIGTLSASQSQQVDGRDGRSARGKKRELDPVGLLGRRCGDSKKHTKQTSESDQNPRPKPQQVKRHKSK
jgi:hypothetical protein